MSETLRFWTRSSNQFFVLAHPVGLINLHQVVYSTVSELLIPIKWSIGPCRAS